MRDPDRSDPAATRQSRRRRVILEHVVEYSLRPARHREPTREDHDRSRSSVHAGRTRAWFAGSQWFAIGVAVSAGRANCDADTSAAAFTSSAVNCTSDAAIDCAFDATIESTGITRTEEVALSTGTAEFTRAVKVLRSLKSFRL